MQIDLDFLQKRPLSYSALKEFRKSPKHYIHYLTKPRETTAPMIMGQIIECLALEPDMFDKKFMVFEKPNLRTNDGKAEMERMLATANEQHLTIVNKDQVETARRSVQSLMDYDISRDLIEGKKRMQLKLRWIDKETGLPIIGYVDFESRAWDTDFIVDLKSSNNADPDEFPRQAAKLDYHIQAGCYSDGYPRIAFKFPTFVFLVVETDEPFNVSVNVCDSKYISDAKEEFHSTLHAFKYCMDNDLFYQGYEFRKMGTGDYFSMQMPAYYKRKFTVVPQEELI